MKKKIRKSIAIITSAVLLAAVVVRYQIFPQCIEDLTELEMIEMMED